MKFRRIQWLGKWHVQLEGQEEEKKRENNIIRIIESLVFFIYRSLHHRVLQEDPLVSWIVGGIFGVPVACCALCCSIEFNASSKELVLLERDPAILLCCCVAMEVYCSEVQTKRTKRCIRFIHSNNDHKCQSWIRRTQWPKITWERKKKGNERPEEQENSRSGSRGLWEEWN